MCSSTFYRQFTQLVIWGLALLVIPPLASVPVRAQSGAPPTLALSPHAGWFSADSAITNSVALGDVDNDGDLDLAVGHRDGSSSVLVYLNQNGQLNETADWVATEQYRVYSLAWGDVDKDGDLDLAVGTVGQPNVLYLNTGGQLQLHWQSAERDDTESVAWGDLNGDGFLELAVGNRRGQPNRVYFNTNGQLEQTARWRSDERDNTHSVAWADVDCDRDLDLAVGNDDSNAPNQLYFNDHGVLAQTAGWTAAMMDRTQEIAWGDVNGDCYPDLAVANNGRDYLYLNQHGILSRNPTWLSDEDDVSNALAWGDVDADGDLDLAVGLSGVNYRTGVTVEHTQIYLNQNGLLSTSPDWRTDNHDVNSIALGDLNSDGLLDLVVGTGDQDKIYFTPGHSLQSTAAWSSDDVNRTRAVAWGDVDGDGQLELAAGNWGQLNKLYLDQAGVALGSTWGTDDQSDSFAVAAGDMDHDGDLDLAVAKRGANVIYRNDNGVLQTPPIWQSTETDDSLALAWGDLDGDDYPELAVGNDRQPTRLYLNDAGVLQATAVWSSEDMDETHAVRWGDMDGDGALDLAAINRGDPNRVYLNVGGQLAPHDWASTETDNTNSLAWGDFNRDGLLDLVAGNTNSPTRIYFNTGNGMLSTAAAWASTAVTRTYSVAVADIDKDGDLDLATGNSRENHLYLNNGGVLSQSTGWTSTERDRTRAVAWGDLDNDGYPELAAATEGGFQGSDGLDKIYRNVKGTLEPTAFWAGGSAADETTSVAWGDVNQDGFLDLIFGVQGGQPSRLYLNQAGTIPTAPSWTSPVTPNTQSVAWGDVNGDGYPDLAVGNLGGVNQLYLNENGMLQSVVAWTSQDQSDTYQVIWGDVDRDGDLDLIAGNYRTANRLYLNTYGQLSAQGISLGDDDQTQAVALGDVDQNGTLDLAVGNRYANRLLLNRGGMFTRRQWLSADAHSAKAGGWADIDNDGDLDLLAGTHLYRNDGNWLQEYSSSIISAVDNDPQQVAWADLNHDDYPELAVANWQKPNHVYANLQGTLAPNALWTSPTVYDTQGIAWADVDRDGDLDLAVGNDGDPNHLYLNHNGTLATNPDWVSNDADHTQDLIWADINKDNYPDLMAANKGQDKLYWNATGVLQATASWSSSDAEQTAAVAWGDGDGDGDLDLAVANAGAPNKVYWNVAGVLQTDTAWVSQDSDDSTGVAWGDVDGDGDLDLAVSNDHAPNKIYRNTGQTLDPVAWWQSADDVHNTSLAWGDVDNDGDLDLAVGVMGRANRLYINTSQQLTTTAIAIGRQEDDTRSVAWGDVDGDGDLDLAVGNLGGPNRVYFNEGGTLNGDTAWDSGDSDDTRSIAWGDWDDDGDLDLAAGNSDTVNKVYRNAGGVLHQDQVWRSTESDATYSIAWGDWDGDGDLDLAAGNNNGPNRLYLNQHRLHSRQVEQPAYAILNAPQSGTYSAATPQISHVDQMIITYTLVNPTGPSAHRILLQYAIDGSNHWQPATPVSATETISRATSRSGVTHLFHWQISADPIIKNDHVRFRLLVLPAVSYGPIRWPAMATESQPFRYAAPWYAKVIDESGNPLAAATIYHAGLPYPQTNRAGLVQLPALPIGTELAVLAPQHEQPSPRAQHDSWAYRIYTTNLSWTNASAAELFTVIAPDEQRLMVRSKNTLILFNLLISIEWDASDEYLLEIAEMARLGSTYLFDLTDGQMALGKVTVVDNARDWQDADVRIFAKNRFLPYATFGGILRDPAAGSIHLGRQWDRDRGPGQWRAPDGYRTFIHEFGHYALHLYDEYFVHIFDAAGNFVSRESAFCVKHKDELRLEQGSTASAMYWQYDSTELSATGVPGLWPPAYSDNCEWTEQWQRTKREQKAERGESTWETLARQYRDNQSAVPRWQIVTPVDRGQLLTGPVALPSVLPAWPDITTINLGAAALPVRTLTLTGPAAFQDAFVTLYTQTGRTINQGFISSTGTIAIYGAADGDQLEVNSRNGRFTGRVLVSSATEIMLALTPVQHNNPTHLPAPQSVETLPTAQVVSNQQEQTLYAEAGTATLSIGPGSIPTDSGVGEILLGIASTDLLPDTLPPGTQLRSAIYTIITNAPFTAFDKPAILEIYGNMPGNYEIYHYSPDSNTWLPLPSTLDTNLNVVSTLITDLGVYALLQKDEQEQPYHIFLPNIHHSR